MPRKSNPQKKRARNELERANVLQKSGDEFVKKYTVVKATSKAYQGYIRRGKAFLQQLVVKRRETEEGHTCKDEEIDLPVDKLEVAFDNPPNKYSAIVIEMFITQKCVKESRKGQTAEGIHAAWCEFWDKM
jgi:hypothetical protein